MPARRIGGRIYEEIAVTATTDKPLPVDIGSSSIDLSGTTLEVGDVTIVNTNANPIPVSDGSGSLSVDDGGGSLTVDGPLTDAQLRTSAISAQVASLPLPDGAASAALQTTGNTTLGAINTKLPSAVSGRLPVDGSGVTQPISDGGGSITVDGPLTDSQLRATSVPISDGGGSLTVDGTVAVSGTVATLVAARTPTTASVSASVTSQLLLALNAGRRGLSISNVSTHKIYLSFSNPATIANCFMELGPGGFLLLDQQLIATNAIYGVWTGATGTCQITEYV
tara:strand:+ start:229 stop:1071 length:843 start_codon:yes stop_codon:yes gene_type:complete